MEEAFAMARRKRSRLRRLVALGLILTCVFGGWRFMSWRQQEGRLADVARLIAHAVSVKDSDPDRAIADYKQAGTELAHAAAEDPRVEALRVRVTEGVAQAVPGASDAVGAAKHAVGAAKEMVGTAKEAVGAAKDAVGAAKDVLDSAHDVAGQVLGQDKP